MNLTIKDAITTVVAAIVGYLTYLKAKGLDLPITALSNNRLTIGLFLILGIVMCTQGTPGTDLKKDMLLMTLSVLGGLALVLGIWGLITNGRVPMLLLGGDILLLWFLSTLRHLLTK